MHEEKRATESDFLLRPAHSDDVAFMVDLHLTEFPESYYAQLGPRYLSRRYRRWLGSSSTYGTVACTAAGAPVGYALGWSTLRRTPVGPTINTSIAACTALAMRPSLWGVGVLTQVRRIRRNLGRLKSRQDSTVRCELAYIAVVPGFRNHGVGSAMLDAVRLWAVHEERIASMTLVTEADNVTAQSFYERRGWSQVALTRSGEGRPLVRMETDL